jgi:hypothetical protein
MKALAQVVLDRQRTEKQPRSDLRVREPVTREPSNQRLLGSQLTAGRDSARISDGVDQATVRASDSFPYLAPPNPDPVVAGRVLVPSKLADQLAFLQQAFAAPTG